MTRRKGSAEGRSAPAERPSRHLPRVGLFKRLCGPPERVIAPVPLQPVKRGIGLLWAAVAEWGPGRRGQSRRSIFVRDKSRGSSAPPAGSHRPATRGGSRAFGLSDCPVRGGHIGASGLTSGVRSCAKPRRKPVSAGLITGISASKSQNTPALARASKHAVAC